MQSSVDGDGDAELSALMESIVDSDDDDDMNESLDVSAAICSWLLCTFKITGNFVLHASVCRLNYQHLYNVSKLTVMEYSVKLSCSCLMLSLIICDI